MSITIQIWEFLLLVVCLGGAAIVIGTLLNREIDRSMYWQRRADEAESRLEAIRQLKGGRNE